MHGMTGVFAVDNVSGCYGPEGFFMWGDGTHPIVPKEEGKEEKVMNVPKKVAEWTNVKKVRASCSHILVMLDAPESRKREAAPQEENASDAKKVEVQA